MRKKRRRSSSARRPNAIQGKARHGQRLARAGHGCIKRGTGPVGNALGPSLGPNRCDIGDYHLQSFNQPIQHSRPACSKRNSHERLLAVALGVKMVVCLGPASGAGVGHRHRLL